MRQIHAQGEVIFLPPQHGGRKNPAFANMNYRPQFHINGQDWDSQQRFPELNPGDILVPGKPHRVWFHFFNLHPLLLKTGQNFLIKEGARVVGAGKLDWVNRWK